ncbi:MAG: hypothetical protein ACRCUE_15360, partial [Bosea sp. (in: a-proteobacteria)]
MKSIRAKLAAPIVLFLIPIGFLLFFLVTAHNKAIAVARNEISGVVPAVAAVQIMGSLLQTSLGAGDASSLLSIESNVAVLKREASKWLLDAHTTEQFRQSIAEVEQTLRSDRTSLSSIGPVLRTLARLTRSIGDSSELILDPELDTYYLMDMLIVQAPVSMLRLHDSLVATSPSRLGESNGIILLRAIESAAQINRDYYNEALASY